MDLKNLAAQLLKDKLGADVDTSNAGDAIEGLLGGGGLNDLVGKFTNSGLAEQAKSWLGDGENASVSAAQIQEALDGDQIKGFADKLGLDQGEAAEKLSNLLPGLVDKASSGGSLLDNIGGLGGLAGMAKKFF
ncbi:MAG: DUF937 domain-containing protein [Gammaproteobacteria bacterium]|nr:DUF937 domain-containing protein [Gammaproteobacteria bacterium]NNM14684.1 DUF937 domain-containing protein [Gammaproteobacteria bacterium]